MAPETAGKREHAYLRGFPADSIVEVKALLDPSLEGRWVEERDASKESGIY